MFLLPGSNCEELIRNLSRHLRAELVEVEKRRFPDGELYVRIKGDLSGKDVVLVSDIRTEAGLIETVFLLEAARGMEPASLKIFVPYFSYMRQHTRYNPGEPISSKIVVDIFDRYVDAIYTAEIHDEETIGYSSRPFTDIKIQESIKEYYMNRNIDMLISPDDGGMERASRIASLLGIESAYFDKVRIDSRNVEIKPHGDIDVKGKNILLIDDMISTGGTIKKAIGLLKSMGAAHFNVCAIHGLFKDDSGKKLSELADDLAVTNTVQGDYSKIDISSEVAKYLMGE